MQLHDCSFQNTHHRRNIQQMQNHRLLGPKDISSSDTKDKIVTNLTGSPGNANSNRLQRHPRKLAPNVTRHPNGPQAALKTSKYNKLNVLVCLGTDRQTADPNWQFLNLKTLKRHSTSASLASSADKKRALGVESLWQ